jgi:predicted metalloprotease with PDZ domain
LNLQWNAVALYPAGYFTRQITIEPSVRLPDGWQIATALETASSHDGVTTFKPVSFETLVDSPIFAGRYFKRLDLDPAGPARRRSPARRQQDSRTDGQGRNVTLRWH